MSQRNKRPCQKTSEVIPFHPEWVGVRCKPLSQNKTTLGRKVKSPEYRDYERNLISLLPPMVIPDGPLVLKLLVTYSSAASDIDNALKPFIDVLQKRYDFNDNRIYELRVRKRVCKGKEGIKFLFDKYTGDTHVRPDTETSNL